MKQEQDSILFGIGSYGTIQNTLFMQTWIVSYLKGCTISNVNALRAVVYNNKIILNLRYIFFYITCIW